MMGDVVEQIVNAGRWDERVQLVRRIPEQHGRAALRQVYADLARRFYVPSLTPDFAYVYWREEYEQDAVDDAYQAAHRETAGFTRVSVEDVRRAIVAEPRTTLIWRLLVGYTRSEMAAAIEAVAVEDGSATSPPKESRLQGLEHSRRMKKVSPGEARLIAEVTVRAVEGRLWPSVPDGRRTKQQRPDLAEGWQTIRSYASEGVPLPVLLHQRLYGGSFRQLLDSTSSMRGDSLEAALVAELDLSGVQYLQTSSHNQGEIKTRFNITIQPAPDFVFFDSRGALRALLEAKLTNDGGTARDKAGRFASLRRECERLGGVPLFALVDGLGWARAADALGPVVSACDGRVFTRATLSDMFEVDPFPLLLAEAGGQAT